MICSKFQIICIPSFQFIQILNVLNFFANETTFAILGTHLWPLSVNTSLFRNVDKWLIKTQNRLSHTYCINLIRWHLPIF